MMSAEQGVGGFFRHRALILVAAGGAVAEAGFLTAFAPAARPVAPQVTALPSIAAYHDLRWLFADGGSWAGFAAIMLAVLLARAALDAVLLLLAWPRTQPSSVPPPRPSRAFWSCLGLTAVSWVLLSPAATLTFGVAVLPFSWPLIGALPIMLGVLLALSHGGTIMAWWRRLPPPMAVGWLVASFVVLSGSAALITHLDTAGALAITAITGLVNARMWYGMATLAARLPARSPSWPPARVLPSIPLAPLAGLLALVLVVGATRLMFTGTIKLFGPPHGLVAASSTGSGSGSGGGRDRAASQGRGDGTAGTSRTPSPAGAVLVVEGWGSWCCDAANGLRPLLQEAQPGMLVRQFSYQGLDASGNPLRSGPADDDLSLPELGDKIAGQLEYLHDVTHAPVDVVAESEGTLGIYAMLARHPGLPVGSVVLLSPIIAPGQLSFPTGPQGPSAIPPLALDELNHLIGTISPYGSAGAQQLLASVSEFGARYFSGAGRSGGKIRWLGVVPLADALTLPACDLAPGIVVVPAFHGGLLGHPDVLPMVAAFLEGQPPGPPGADQARLREAAEAITSAASAWRMPNVSNECELPLRGTSQPPDPHPTAVPAIACGAGHPLI